MRLGICGVHTLTRLFPVVEGMMQLGTRYSWLAVFRQQDTTEDVEEWNSAREDSPTARKIDVPQEL